MENASKALLMAASVLIGMIILTMGVYLYTTIGAYVRESQEQIERETINKFNVQFYNYLSEENEIFSFQEIVTIANVAYENNYKYELPTTKDSAEIVKKYNGKNNYVQVVLKGYMLNETDVTNNSINLEFYV